MMTQSLSTFIALATCCASATPGKIVKTTNPGSLPEVTAISTTWSSHLKLSKQDGVSRSLIELSPTGNSSVWQTNDHLSIASRAFEPQAVLRGAFFNPGKRQAVVELDRNYDLLELWVGAGDGSTSPTEFEIRGDDDSLWSKTLYPGEKAEHIALSIKDRRSLAFVYNASSDSCTVVIGEPTLRRLSSRVPTPISPIMGEHISIATPLVWHPVVSAQAYLLELQCYEVADQTERGRADRFIVQIIPADQADYRFDATKLPRGMWRWRVHALGERGFLGESGTWFKFVSSGEGRR